MEEMTTGEEIEKLAKENRTWEILEIIRKLFPWLFK